MDPLPPSWTRALDPDQVTYALPEDRIAKQPVAPRDAAKLLVANNNELKDHLFRELPSLLPPNALLVLNDTKVVPARLVFQRETGGRVEVFCLNPIAPTTHSEAFEAKGECAWLCMLGNAKRWQAGEQLTLQVGGSVLIAERAPDLGENAVRFNWTPERASFGTLLENVGHVPLPPYLNREDTPADKKDYQTIYAAKNGAVAAPTAGLHFTPALLSDVESAGIRTARVTLHVGAGTFRPLDEEGVAHHAMHAEVLRVSKVALQKIAEHEGPIVPVGTTALRTLESLVHHAHAVQQGRTSPGKMDLPQWAGYGDYKGTREDISYLVEQLGAWDAKEIVGQTQLMIVPGYDFQLTDALVTNFHQPGSTLLLLIAALIGPRWQDVYAHAMAHDYRFLSYGDGSLLSRAPKAAAAWRKRLTDQLNHLMDPS